MSKETLFNLYRPNSFGEVVEQEIPKKILSEELRTRNFKRVLLFTGGAGTGKTTSARIYANEIEPVASNIYEVNCADKTKVDDIRNVVLEGCKTKPLTGEYKIYILDEVHMMSQAGQSALLKILEEPPSYCIFILCTTDPQKLFPTIESRSFRYDFKLISTDGIKSRLAYILQSEREKGSDGCGIIDWQDEALDYISQVSNGHMRDAIVLLEKAISFSKHLTVDDVVKVLGTVNYDIMFNLLYAIINKKESDILNDIDNIHNSGSDLKLFIKRFLDFVLEVNKYLLKKAENINNLNVRIPHTYDNHLQKYSIKDRDSIKHLLKTLLELNSSLRYETNPLSVIESNMIMEIL